MTDPCNRTFEIFAARPIGEMCVCQHTPYVHGDDGCAVCAIRIYRHECLVYLTVILVAFLGVAIDSCFVFGWL